MRFVNPSTRSCQCRIAFCVFRFRRVSIHPASTTPSSIHHSQHHLSSIPPSQHHLSSIHPSQYHFILHPFYLASINQTAVAGSSRCHHVSTPPAQRRWSTCAHGSSARLSACRRLSACTRPIKVGIDCSGLDVPVATLEEILHGRSRESPRELAGAAGSHRQICGTKVKPVTR